MQHHATISNLTDFNKAIHHHQHSKAIEFVAVDKELSFITSFCGQSFAENKNFCLHQLFILSDLCLLKNAYII
ncbi:CLUMA_CG010610, isoform A [Clunio marinus]|uniref:CLUMA_CG010610, isoform A n=1 Tax=Clunio marinus TaxID=568069 RepID=A0A1J1IAA4_9DIPT|nr:CLUMA_CG010610, isoform A [Clunio marinus]